MNPVIRLDQTGLRAGLARRATIDHQSVTLPTGDVAVAFGTGHSFSFPRVVVGDRGGAYLTRTPAFTGPVASNLLVTARYRTMSNVLSAEAAIGGVDPSAEQSLRRTWSKVRVGLAKGQAVRARHAVQRFADEVSRLTGKQIERPSARKLLAFAQLVYDYVDGKGSL